MTSIVKSPFFNYGLKFVNHYDCTQYTSSGIVILQVKMPSLLGFGYTLDAKDATIDPNKLEGRVLLRIVGHITLKWSMILICVRQFDVTM
jgi:hypothetical protein